MTLWATRFGLRMSAILGTMLLVEFASYFFATESGWNRLYWVPVSFLLVAYAGYDTVRRLPLIWGVVVGVVLAGTVSMVSLLIGSYVIDGQFRLPAEAEPLLLATTLLLSSLLGGFIGGAAGVVARSRRRQRARRSAIRKLAYTAMDDPAEATPDIARTAATEPLVDRPLRRAAEGG
jgi:hypothetical protein